MSVITSALTFATIGFDRWKVSMGKAGEQAEKTKNEVSAIATAVGTAAADTTRVEALASALSNTNATLGEKKRILQELKGINESDFGDLKIEDGLYDKLITKVGQYSQALILNNVQKARGEDLTKAQIDEQDLRGQISDLDAIISRHTQLARARFADIQSRKLEDLTGISSVADILRNDQVQKDAITKRITLYDQLGAATDKAGKLSILYEYVVKSALSVPSLDPGKGAKTDPLKDAIKDLETYGKEVGFTASIYSIPVISWRLQLAIVVGGPMKTGA